MKFRNLLALGAAASAATLVYGCLVETNRLVLERRRLRLPNWPGRLAGFKIAVLADLHVRDAYSVAHAKRAVGMALDEIPDVVVLPGDLIGYWKPESAWMLEDVLEPLLLMEGSAIAVPGNREYWSGHAGLLEPILSNLNIKLLRNEAWIHKGICWAGVDSVNAYQADPIGTMAQTAEGFPTVTLWHEPDLVEWLPSGAELMISGHTHGGQFTFPWGWTPMTSKNGKKYMRGWFPGAPTPLYVSRGVGYTGPPSRLNCPPEVSLLELWPG